jgi:alginate O-acetyltransferase complex protein AlgJ
MKLGTPARSRFFTPAAGETVEASGIVEAVASVPRPGSVPYADHITAIHLTEISISGRPTSEPLQAVVYLWSMRDNVWTAGARLRPGDRVTLRLRAWADVAPQLEQINRSEIDDPEIQLEEPAWGELLP